MVFTSQFTLSLELTRLIPLDLLSRTAAGAIMNLAREFQNAGTDIIIEEDLAEVFGRCRISRNLESSFRTCVAVPGTRHPLFERIVIDDGPGPTVSRSLSNSHPAYLATVIQLSLLSSVHDRRSLAAHTALALEERNIGSPTDKVRPVPSQEGIAGVIRAVEDHTSQYNWRGLIEAVATTLGIKPEDASKPLAPSVFRGATLMFPMVQTLPVDREILVQTNTGICLLVVWAHHVLGLDVLMKHCEDPTYGPMEFEEFYFGTEKAQVIIEYSQTPWVNRGDSITLLEADSKEELFHLKADHEDEETLEPIITWPVNEYGCRTLAKYLSSFKAITDGARDIGIPQDAILNDMMHITCARALTLEKYLRRRDRDSARDCLRLGRFQVSEERIIEAGSLIFHKYRLDKTKILEYVELYANEPSKSMKQPESMFAAALKLGSGTYTWTEALLLPAHQLSVLILALANLVELDSAQELLLNSDLDIVFHHKDLIHFNKWDGRTRIYAQDGLWYDIIALLMVGHREKSANSNAFIESTALISEKGWTICNNAIGRLDPSQLVPGAIIARRGVPCRDGVRKHAIICGPTTYVPKIQERQYKHHAGQLVSLNSGGAISTEWARPFCADQGDNFLVSLRIAVKHKQHSTIRRCSHRELSRALWAAERTSPCEHGRDRPIEKKAENEEMKLPEDSVAVAIEGEGEINLITKKVVVCLTAASAAARWRSLIAINSLRGENMHQDYVRKGRSTFHILLRKDDCCNTCAVNQAFLFPSQCFVVL